MNIICLKGYRLLLQFDENEEFISSLIIFCQKYKITSGFFYGIGAASEITVSFYDLNKRIYSDKIFNGDLELLNISGNISLFEGNPIIHAHGIFSDLNFQTFGGHMKKMVISGTCEIYLQLFSEPIHREYDHKTGLKLLK